MLTQLRLSAEIGVARTAGRLSRLARAGGGTTVPGSVLAKLDSSAVDRLGERLADGSALVSATNGKTTTTAMAAEILAGSHRLVHNRSGANLVSGVASALLEAGDARLGLFEVDEAALPEVARRLRPRAICLGNLFRDQLDRYGELEHLAGRWCETVAGLPDTTVVAVNGDDPLVGALVEGRAGSVVFGVDDPRLARASLQHAADSKYCQSCGAPYEYRASYVGHLGDYRCPSCGRARPPLAVAARKIELHGLEGSSFRLFAPSGSVRVELALPGLYNVYNALAAAALAIALDAGLEEIAAGLGRAGAAFGRFERIEIGDQQLLILLIKNPAGANEAFLTLVAGGAPSVALIALNDDTADGKDVSWIWDVDFEPLLDQVETVICSGARAVELALRCKYAESGAPAVEVVPELDRALDLGLALTPPDGQLVALPTYTAMLALREIVGRRGHVRPYWEGA